MPKEKKMMCVIVVQVSNIDENVNYTAENVYISAKK